MVAAGRSADSQDPAPRRPPGSHADPSSEIADAGARQGPKGCFR